MRPRLVWAPFVVLLFIIAVRAAQLVVNVGTTANDATGDTLRVGFQKVNSNYTEIFGWQTNGMPFTNRASNPATPATNNFILFSKSVGGVAKPHFIDDAGNVVNIGAAAVAGSTGDVQWNSNSALTADSLFSYSGSTKTLSVPNISSSTQANFALVGIKSATPTHSLTLGSTGTGYAQYGTADQTVNYQRLRLSYSSDLFGVASEVGGSANAAELKFSASKGSDQTYLTLKPTLPLYSFTHGSSSAATGSFMDTFFSPSATSGNQTLFNLASTIAQGGTAGYAGLAIALVQDSVGTGAKLPINVTIGGSSIFAVTNTGQVGIGTGTPAASAMLDVTSTTRGALIPRLTSAQEAAVSSPATGLLIFNTTSNLFRFYNGSAWVNVSTVPALSTLTDVQLGVLSDGDVLTYDSATSKWVDRAATGAVTNYYDTTIITNNYFITGKGNVLHITNNITITGSLTLPWVEETGTVIDWATNSHWFQLTSSPTFTFTHLTNGHWIYVGLEQDATGGRTVTWPSGIVWPNTNATTTIDPATNANAVTFYRFARRNGTNYCENVESRWNRDQLNAKLPLGGGTMTGLLTLSADPTSALHASSKQYVDAAFAQQTFPLASLGMVTAIFPRSDSATLVAMGEVLATMGGSYAAVASTASRPGHLTATTGATIGNQAGWESGQRAWNSARTTVMDCTVFLAQAVSNRFWFGFCAVSAGTTGFLALDEPLAPTAGFRFSPESAGDTQLKAVTILESGGLTDIANTGWGGGSAISNTVMRLSIVLTPSPASVKYYTNGVLCYTTTGNLIPTNTALLKSLFGVETRVAAGRGMGWFGYTVKQTYQSP